LSSKNQKSNDGVDFVSPLSDILLILIEQLSIFLVFASKWGIGKIAQKYFGVIPNQPVKLKQLRSNKRSVNTDELGYSLNNKSNFKLTNLNTGKHTAVIGSTGSGKTVCLQVLIDHALRSGRPVIYFDPKASKESIRTFRKMCHAQNKKLYIFSDISENATPFNPLLDGSLDDISDRIINALDWSEPFYKNESISALDEVLEALRNNDLPITLERITSELTKHKNLKNIKGLVNQLSKVSKSPYGKLLNYEGKDSLSFNSLRLQNACIYIGVSSMGHSSSGNILNKIFFGGLLNHTKESLTGKVPGLMRPLEKPISVVFDELSSTIHEGFIDLQNKCREAGIEITYATQGPSDIDRISPILTQQIFENTNNLFVFNQVVPEHTEFFARTFGTVKNEKKTHVIENDRRVGTGTEREVEEFVVHSNILRSLKVGQCILYQRVPKRINLLNIRHFKVNEIDLPDTNAQEGRSNSIFS
tara:strand:- start:54813 stop:56234 length:1422 start_codon:yes stop_codon:yes gene_type:complete